MKEFIKQNTIVYLIILVAIVIVISVVFSFYNRKVMADNVALKAETETIINAGLQLSENLSNLDKALRAYALSKHTSHFGHYKDAVFKSVLAFDMSCPEIGLHKLKSKNGQKRDKF